ncbi:uncharacterized protein LOC134267170 isoform X1 [Saccostrea cucullata]|uniref:uncharacterized protein LOC134267170 isoform X1 n=2 Tax=Saccostrea cuccullata TaxID=36930 RepID=UPI002ED3AB7A
MSGPEATKSATSKHIVQSKHLPKRILLFAFSISTIIRMVEFIYFVCLIGVTNKIFALPVPSTDLGDSQYFGESTDVEDVSVPVPFLVNYENLINSDEDLSYPVLPLPQNPPEWLMTLIHRVMSKSSDFSNRQKRGYLDYSDPALQALLHAFYKTYGGDGKMGIRYGRSVQSLRRSVPVQHRIFHNSFLKQMKADSHSRGRYRRTSYRQAELQRILKLFYSRGKYYGKFGIKTG